MLTTTRTVWFLLFAFACSSDPPKPPVIPEADTDFPPNIITCPIDPSISPESAVPLTLTQGEELELEARICPRADIDFWSLSTTLERALVTVVAEVDHVSDLRLAARWDGPVGLCMPSTPRDCSDAQECGDEQLCDTNRGGCRQLTAPYCFTPQHCEGSCVPSIERVAAAFESDIGSVRHRLSTVFPAFYPGEYLLSLEDANWVVNDTDVRLTLALDQDRDIHEPNNDEHLATELQSGTFLEGSFGYIDDVDWYRVDPSSHLSVTSQPVVHIEVQWPNGIPAEPSWTLRQGRSTFVTPFIPDRLGSIVVAEATVVIPSATPFFVEVQNPSGVIDATSTYTITVTISEDLDEPQRNDSPSTATVLDATTFASLHDSSHLLVAENDTDWFRIDRSAIATDNSLLHFRATAPIDAPYLLQALFWERTGASCDVQSETRTCVGESLCVCPTDSCTPSDGVCIQPWTQLPVPRDPGGDEQEGGRSPNHIETQLPLFDSGDGALFVQVRHIRASTQGRDGFSATVPYQLSLSHAQEPDIPDRSALREEVLVRPFNTDASEFFGRANPTTLSASISSAPVARGFVTLAPAAQATIDPGVESCVTLTLAGFDNRGQPLATGESSTVSVIASAGSPVVDCGSMTPLPNPTTLIGPDPTIGLMIAAGTFVSVPSEMTLSFTGGALEPVDALLSVNDSPLPPLVFTDQPPSPLIPAGPAARFFTVDEPSPPLRVTASPGADLLMDLTVAPADARIGSADFGPTAQYCVCDIDCVDVCECSGSGCDACACEPSASCSEERGCSCTSSIDGLCPALPAFAMLSPACHGSLYGATAQSSCQTLVLAGEMGRAFHLARSTPGAVMLHARAPGFASATWVLVTDVAATLSQTPTGLSGNGFISYAGDQDWYAIDVTGFPPASAQLRVAFAASSVDLRMRIIRGNNPDDGLNITGTGRYSDICDLSGHTCGDVGASCDTARNSCDQDVLGTPASPAEIAPGSACTYLAGDADRLYLWVNDVHYNDWDTLEPYSFRIDLIEGCSTACSPFRCAR